jgi:hypothetical protein
MKKREEYIKVFIPLMIKSISKSEVLSMCELLFQSYDTLLEVINNT